MSKDLRRLSLLFLEGEARDTELVQTEVDRQFRSYGNSCPLYLLFNIQKVFLFSSLKQYYSSKNILT